MNHITITGSLAPLKIKALLEGKVVQHRIPVTLPKWLEGGDLSSPRAIPGLMMGVTPGLFVPAEETLQRLRNPWGWPGEPPLRLWVREVFCVETNESCELDSYVEYNPPHDDGRPVRRLYSQAQGREIWQQPHYKTDGAEPPLCYEDGGGRPNCPRCEEGEPHAHWSSPAVMPRWASRMTVELVGVSVQRVQSITEEGVQAECVETRVGEGMIDGEICYLMRGATCYGRGLKIARMAFESHWDADHGKGAWERNDWVWVPTIRKVGNDGED